MLHVTAVRMVHDDIHVKPGEMIAGSALLQTKKRMVCSIKILATYLKFVI